VSGLRTWFAALPAPIRWTALTVVAILVVTVIAAGASTWMGHREELAQRALGTALVTAQRAVGSGEAGELDAAATALHQFLTSYPSARVSTQARYVLGQVEFRRSQWEAAAAAFGEAARRDRGTVGRLSRLGQGYAYESKGELPKAIEVYQEALSGLGPKDFLYGDLLLAKARAHELAKDSSAAIATYKQYLKDLPTSDRGDDVRIRLALLGGTS